MIGRALPVGDDYKLRSEMTHSELVEDVRTDVLCAVGGVDLCPHVLAQILVSCAAVMLEDMEGLHNSHGRDCAEAYEVARETGYRR
jgi:hypothetical protein